MGAVIGLFLLCLAICSHAVPYNGCTHQRVGSATPFPLLCGNPGYLKTPAPLGPQFVTSARNETTALQVCEYACFDNVYCKSWAYRAKDSVCRLLAKHPYDMGWEPQANSDVKFWQAECTGGGDEPFPAGAWVTERFQQNNIKVKISPQNNWHYGQDRCKTSSSSVLIVPPLSDIVTLQRDMSLPNIGGQYNLRFDFLYQNPDPMSIIFGYVSYNDKWPGPDQFFELARANDRSLDGVWQTAKFRFDTDHTKKYRLTLEFGHQPGATLTNRTTWGIDNLVIYSA